MINEVVLDTFEDVVMYEEMDVPIPPFGQAILDQMVASRIRQHNSTIEFRQQLEEEMMREKANAEAERVRLAAEEARLLEEHWDVDASEGVLVPRGDGTEENPYQLEYIPVESEWDGNLWVDGI